MPKQSLQQGRFLTEQPGSLGREALKLEETICTIYLVLMSTVHLLFFYPGVGYRNITGAKRTTFFILTGLYLIALLLSPKSQEDRQLLKQRLKRCSVALWAMLAYLLLTVVSGLLSPHGSVVWVGYTRNEGVITQMLYVLVFATLMLFARPKQWLLFPLGATVIVMTVIAVLQVLGGDPLDLYPNGRSYVISEGRFLTTVGNVDFTSGLLCVLIPLFAATMIRGRGWERFLLILPLSVALYLLLQIDVLGGYVGMSVGTVLVLPIVLRFSGKATLWYYILIALAGIAGVAGLYLFDIGGGMFHEIHEILHGNLKDMYGSGRIYIWRQVLERIPKRLWFGYGPDTMKLEMLSPFQRYDPENQKWITARIDVAHNEYLNILFHQGVFALAAYLVGVITAVVHFFRYGKRNARAAIFGAAVVCYLVQAFFNISQLLTTPFFWISMGLLEAAVVRLRCESGEDTAPRNALRPQSVGRFERRPG